MTKQTKARSLDCAMQSLRLSPARVLTLFVLTALAFFVAFQASKAYAQTSACDPQYMDALESRAWLEAQREITQNANIISKPDSVLQYSCFSVFMGAAGRALSSYSGGDASAFAQTIMSMYLQDNFSHPFLGGRSSLIMADVLIDNQRCDAMRAVWQEAKCMNMNSLLNSGPIQNLGFLGFPFMKNLSFQGDFDLTRPYPLTWNTASVCSSLGGELSKTYGNAMNQAFNGQEDFYTFPANQEKNGALYDSPTLQPYVTDAYNPYMEQILPKGYNTGSGTISCAAPIYTGITVERVGFSPSSYPDAVCPNPGCHYVPTSATGGNCQ